MQYSVDICWRDLLFRINAPLYTDRDSEREKEIEERTRKHIMMKTYSHHLLEGSHVQEGLVSWGGFHYRLRIRLPVQLKKYVREECDYSRKAAAAAAASLRAGFHLQVDIFDPDEYNKVNRYSRGEITTQTQTRTQA